MSSGDGEEVADLLEVRAWAFEKRCNQGLHLIPGFAFLVIFIFGLTKKPF